MERENIIIIIMLLFNLLFWGSITLDYITEYKNKGKSKEKDNT